MPGREFRQSSIASPGFFHGYFVVIAAFCVLAGIVGSRYVFGVFFNPILTEFGWTRAMTSGAFSLSVFTEGFMAIVMGWLTDRLGPRIALTICGLFVSVGYLLMSMVGSVWHLYLFYGVLIGIGMGGAIVPLVSTVARWFVARRTTMTGIIMTGSALGSFIAPPLAHRLIDAYGWRISYRILAGIVFAIVILAAQFLKRDPGSIGQVPYGKKVNDEPESKPAVDSYSIGEAAHTRQFWFFIVQLACFGFIFFTIMVHIVPHATDLGISAARSANILATISGLTIVGRLVLGNLADRIGDKRTIIIAFVLALASLFWLVPATEAWMLYLVAIIFGLADGGHGPAQSPLVAEHFGLRSHGLILGVMSFSFTCGGAIGPILAGHIFDVTGSYQLAFYICIALCIIGLISTSLLNPMKGERRLS